MNLFEWLLIGHLIGDYLLQNRWMALNKSNQLLPLGVHSFVYTACVYICSLAIGGISITGAVIIFLSHVILDQRQVVRWWLTNVCKSPDMFWMQVMIDQIFHLLILVLVANLHSLL